MIDLHISVNNKIATFQRRDGDIVCGNSDYQIKFTFDEEWEAYENKIARFVFGGQFQDVEFTGNTCPVPILSGVTLCEVGVYAGELCTTTSAFIACKPSILCREASPSVENDGYYANEARKYAEEAKKAAAGATESGATFTPSVAADGTLSWTNNKGLENPAPVNIKGPKGDTYTLTDTDKTEIAEKAVGIPDYVIAESERVIDRIIEAQGNRTFTIATITDLHLGSWGYYEGITDYPDGIKHACQALKYIDERIKLDAVAVLGDYTDGMAYDQYDTAVYDFKGVNAVLDKLRFSPNLRLVGNHDFHTKHSPLTYRYVTAYSDDVEWGSCLGGYFYKDFSAQKIRVICLNTSERNHTSVSPTTEQYQWFINTLDLSAKEDASEWQILMLSHIPLDFWADNGAYKFAYILKAYLDGSTWNDGADVTCDFSGGKNVARIVGNIHGHTHNFTVDKLYLGNIEDSTERLNIWRMATPNACFGAENKNYTGYQQDIAYPKTANTAKDTAFCIYSIDLDTCTIKAITYGAGYDRELTYHTEPAFINLLPLSTGADDSIYNGVGWKANTRWSISSQAEKSYEGLYLSGYIPITEQTAYGTCYLKDVNFISGAGTNEIIYFTEKGLREYSEEYGNIEGGVYDKDGVLTQFTIGDSHFKYIRIVSCGFSEASVVTINQPIE